MNKNTIISIIIVVAVVIAGLVLLQRVDSKPGQLDTFAACLGEKGAKFYGAFWCPHCADQKKMFGASVAKLPYVECSTPDSKGQTEECIAAGIQSYPTWIFADGARLNGTQSLETLAEKTQCELPAENAGQTTEDAGGSSSAAQ